MTEYCQIWAQEVNKRNGTSHYCHAGSRGLDGSYYGKSAVPEILEETYTTGYSKEWEWKLRACVPDNEKQCKGCQFKIYSRTKQQLSRELGLQKAKLLRVRQQTKPASETHPSPSPMVVHST